MRVVLSNVPADHAERIARTLVEERLAACVNSYPVQSFYVWKGELTVDQEVTLSIKVAEEKIEQLRSRLRELHPYELPEIVVLEVDVPRSLPEYVSWVRSQQG